MTPAKTTISRAPLTGHSAQRLSLAALRARGVLPSTILFVGPSGIGKFLVARELAQSVLCEAPKDGVACARCHGCLTFAAGNAPDFHVVDCADKERWSITELKELLYSLNLSSFSGRGRVVVFREAELLSSQAANALLKSFEEPRPQTHFILITSNGLRLPPTLVSRCQIWHFNPLTADELRAIMALNPPAEGAPIEKLAVLADGSLENVENLSSRYEEWLELSSLLDSVHAGAIPAITEYASTASKDREALRERIRLVRIYARDRMHAAPNEPKFAQLLLNAIAAERLIFERNLNAAQVITTMLLAFVSDTILNSFTTLTNSATLLDAFA